MLKNPWEDVRLLLVKEHITWDRHVLTAPICIAFNVEVSPKSFAREQKILGKDAILFSSLFCWYKGNINSNAFENYLQYTKWTVGCLVEHVCCVRCCKCGVLILASCVSEVFIIIIIILFCISFFTYRTTATNGVTLPLPKTNLAKTHKSEKPDYSN